MSILQRRKTRRVVKPRVHSEARKRIQVCESRLVLSTTPLCCVPGRAFYNFPEFGVRKKELEGWENLSVQKGVKTLGVFRRKRQWAVGLKGLKPRVPQLSWGHLSAEHLKRAPSVCPDFVGGRGPLSKLNDLQSYCLDPQFWKCDFFRV